MADMLEKPRLSYNLQLFAEGDPDPVDPGVTENADDPLAGLEGMFVEDDANASANANTPDSDPDQDPGDPGDTKTENDDNNSKAKPPTVDPTNSAFAEMRVKLKAFEKFAQSQGKTVDELAAELQEKANETEAKNNNTSPEVWKKLQEQDELIKTLQADKTREFLIKSVEEVKSTFGIDDEGISEFDKQLAANNINVWNTPMDLKILYRGLNHDTIIKNEVEKAVEKAKQEWIANYEKANKHATTPIKGNGKIATDVTPPAGDVISDMKGLNALLGSK